MKEIGIILRKHGEESNPYFFLKTVASNVLIVFFLNNGNTRTIRCGVANIFNKYFDYIAETAKNNIKHPHKDFSNIRMSVLVNYFDNLLIKKK